MFENKIKGHTKFSHNDVVRIKEIGRLPPGHPDRDVKLCADTFGCAPETIRKIWRGDTFRSTGLRVEAEIKQAVPPSPEQIAEWQRMADEAVERKSSHMPVQGVKLPWE